MLSLISRSRKISWVTQGSRNLLVCFLLCSPKSFGGAFSRRVARPSVRQSVRLSVRPYVPNSCPAHNFFIWRRILKLFHRNDHHIETTCGAQHLGRYLEGQGHSMTLQHGVWPITSLFEVGFQNYCTYMIIILRWRNLLPVSKTYSGSITRFDRLFLLSSMMLASRWVREHGQHYDQWR